MAQIQKITGINDGTTEPGVVCKTGLIGVCEKEEVDEKKKEIQKRQAGLNRRVEKWK